MKTFSIAILSLIFICYSQSQDKTPVRLVELYSQLNEKGKSIKNNGRDIITFAEGNERDIVFTRTCFQVFYNNIQIIDMLWSINNYLLLQSYMSDKKGFRAATDLIIRELEVSNRTIDRSILYLNKSFSYVQHGGMVQSMNDLKKDYRDILDLNNQLRDVLNN